MRRRWIALTAVFGLTAACAAAQTKTPAPGRPLIGTYWKATEIAGTAAPAQDAKREAHLVFEAGGRYSGSDGCNGISGPYQLEGNVIKFGTGISTQKACIDIGNFDAAFRGALKSATRLTISADRLELVDATGKRLAIFAGTRNVKN